VTYIVLRGPLSGIVQSFHAPLEDKIDDLNDSFLPYEELECVFSKFPKYHTKSLLGNSSTKIGKKKFSNQQLGMKSYMKLQMITVTKVNFATSNNFTGKSTMFPDRNSHKYA
jgi:hypothetical protein